jgi:predicted NAD/FAD-dependent oxidoreductase
LFDKGRTPGGRLATRRAEISTGLRLGFDHGAQYLTARNPGFSAVLAAHAVPWPAVEDRAGAHVATPGMSGLARALATGLDVAAARRRGGGAGSGWLGRAAP